MRDGAGFGVVPEGFVGPGREDVVNGFMRR